MNSQTAIFKITSFPGPRWQLQISSQPRQFNLNTTLYCLSLDLVSAIHFFLLRPWNSTLNFFSFKINKQYKINTTFLKPNNNFFLLKVSSMEIVMRRNRSTRRRRRLPLASAGQTGSSAAAGWTVRCGPRQARAVSAASLRAPFPGRCRVTPGREGAARVSKQAPHKARFRALS